MATGRLFPALVAALAASCGGALPEPAPRGDVLLITIDTLRADHLGLYGYARDTTPHIDRWFGSGAIFESAYSVDASTSPSVAAILSGRLPQEHRVRLFYQLLPEDVPVLSDLLRPTFRTAAFVSNMVLTDEAMGLGKRFDHYDDFVDARESRRNSERKVFERHAESTTDAALAWLAHEHERVPAQPLFLWVHYIDPHGPYRPPADWTIPFEPGEARPIPLERVPEHIRERKVEDGNEYVRRYDGEIAYTDREIGRLLEGYAKTRVLDRALVILTADHGESMMDHERWFTHGYHVYEEIVHVPFLVRGPGVEAGRFTALVSSIDVVPTVLRFAGVELPPGLRGADLRQPSRLDAGRTVYSEAWDVELEWRCARQGSEKWMVAVHGNERSVVDRRYYDLRADPRERSPRPPQGEPGPLQSLLELVRTDPDPAGVPLEWQKGIQLDAPKVAPRASAEDLEALKDLGYAR